MVLFYKFKTIVDITTYYSIQLVISSFFVNDPSAGSPTETLLRLLLPLGDKVYLSSRNTVQKVHRITRYR